VSTLRRCRHRRGQRGGLGYVMEGKRLFHRRTVEENLLLGGHTTGRH
jgi:branched-chain amino acid transport system ATP-binding protein